MQRRTTSPALSHSLLLLFTLLLMSACGGDTPAPDTPPAAPEAPAAPTVDLARVGTLDPAPKGKHVIPVAVTADGAIHAFGKRDLSLLDLRGGLQEATKRRDWREPDNSSKCILLVNADAALPWVVSHWIMQVAAEPTVLIYQICFAARPRDTEEVGVLGLVLPKDRGIPATQQIVDVFPVIRVKMSQGEGPAADPEAVGPALETVWMKMGRNSEIKVHLELPDTVGVGVPTGRVLQTLDVAIRTGLSDVVFRSPTLPSLVVGTSADRLQEYVRELASGEGTTRIRVGRDHDVGAWPTDRPRPDVGGILSDERPRADGFELPPVFRVNAGLEFLDEDEEAETSETPAPPSPPDAATTTSKRPPPIDAATRKAAAEAFAPIRKLTGDMEALFGTAMAAKRSGDDAGYRAALGEAVALCYEVQDRWNEVIALMPANASFDEEETAMHHFPTDAAVVDRAITALKNMERRLRN